MIPKHRTESSLQKYTKAQAVTDAHMASTITEPGIVFFDTEIGRIIRTHGLIQLLPHQIMIYTTMSPRKDYIGNNESVYQDAKKKIDSVYDPKKYKPRDANQARWKKMYTADDMIRNMPADEWVTTAEIAEKVGCSTSQVLKELNKKVGDQILKKRAGSAVLWKIMHCD